VAQRVPRGTEVEGGGGQPEQGGNGGVVNRGPISEGDGDAEVEAS
jgi:hypothetical protein